MCVFSVHFVFRNKMWTLDAQNIRHFGVSVLCFQVCSNIRILSRKSFYFQKHPLAYWFGSGAVRNCAWDARGQKWGGASHCRKIIIQKWSRHFYLIQSCLAKLNTDIAPRLQSSLKASVIEDGLASIVVRPDRCLWFAATVSSAPQSVHIVNNVKTTNKW